MLSWSNTNNATGVYATTAQLPLTVNASTGYRGLWIATAMDLNDQSSAYGRVSEMAARTATSCYMKGISENIRLQTSSGLPWFWRRICFTFRGTSLRTFSPLDTPTSTANRYLDTSGGIQRLSFNENLNAMSNTINNHDNVIFKGAKGIDWNDYVVAPIDTAQVNLKYDKVITIQSGNANGVARNYKRWHAMNHNLMYDDDESGDGMATSFFSVHSKVGQGDYYIMDFITGGAAGSASDLLQFIPTTTLYWHEK